MAKRRDQLIDQPGPDKTQKRNLEPLKALLIEHGVTFKGAVGWKVVGRNDSESIFSAAQEAVKRGYVPWFKLARTLMYKAYWSLFDEQEGS